MQNNSFYADLLTFSCIFALKSEEFIILAWKSKVFFLIIFLMCIYVIYLCTCLSTNAWRRQRSKVSVLLYRSLLYFPSQNLKFLVCLPMQPVSLRGNLFLPSLSALVTSIRESHPAFLGVWIPVLMVVW